MSTAVIIVLVFMVLATVWLVAKFRDPSHRRSSGDGMSDDGPDGHGGDDGGGDGD